MRRFARRTRAGIVLTDLQVFRDVPAVSPRNWQEVLKNARRLSKEIPKNFQVRPAASVTLEEGNLRRVDPSAGILLKLPRLKIRRFLCPGVATCEIAGEKHDRRLRIRLPNYRSAALATRRGRPQIRTSYSPSPVPDKRRQPFAKAKSDTIVTGQRNRRHADGNADAFCGSREAGSGGD